MFSIEDPLLLVLPLVIDHNLAPTIHKRIARDYSTDFIQMSTHRGVHLFHPVHEVIIHIVGSFDTVLRHIQSVSLKSEVELGKVGLESFLSLRHLVAIIRVIVIDAKVDESFLHLSNDLLASCLELVLNFFNVCCILYLWNELVCGIVFRCGRL